MVKLSLRHGNPPIGGSHGLPEYAELVCRSNFSFLVGASHPEELVSRAQELGYRALALADDTSLAGVVRAHAEAQRCGLPFIPAARIQTLGRAQAPDLDFVCLPTSREGYAALSQLITLGRRRAPKGSAWLHTTDLLGLAPGHAHVAALPDCEILLLPNARKPLEQSLAGLDWAFNTFGSRLWLGMVHHLDGGQLLWPEWQQWAQHRSVGLVACGDVLMHRRSRKPLLDVLTAIRLGQPVAQCGWALSANAEPHLRSRLRLAQLYPETWLRASVVLAERCQFSLSSLRYEYPDEIVPQGHTPDSWLAERVRLGLVDRYGSSTPSAVLAQIGHELALIAELHYAPYFLTVADIVSWARAQGILCQGRGSAANSAVCYALGITEVDPARMSVLFERFISRERNEPPDIDVDFEHHRREEVIQYIYARYGRNRAALAASVTTYRMRSALRDVGKALGLDAVAIERLTQQRAWWDGNTIAPAQLQSAGLAPESPIVQQWLQLAGTLLGFPRHLSQHVGGFVIAREALTRLVPIENAGMPERTVIQWDKDDLESLGLLKIDILALGMLSALRRALDHLNAWRRLQPMSPQSTAPRLQNSPPTGTQDAASMPSSQGPPPMRLQDIPAECPKTYRMIQAADTVGVFQIESRAQMSMLPRLKPRCFYDLVIEVAIVRPGPIQGGMVHPYLRRRQGLEPAGSPSPELDIALGRTLGVPIFQEQVMQVAMIAAGFTAGEADSLRRSMAAWRRKGGLGPFHQRIIAGMTQRGYSAEFAQQIFQQIEGFGEYGFPESHAASFALLVYASSWIKCHAPAAFLAGLLDAQPMGFYAPAQLIADARRHGVEVLPVCVQNSQWQSQLQARSASSLAPHAQAGDASGDQTLDAQCDQVLNARGAQALNAQGAQALNARGAQHLGPQIALAKPSSQWLPGEPAVRLGLQQIRGLDQEAAQRIVAARQAGGPFASIADLSDRAQLRPATVRLLAQAGALDALSLHRRQAYWEASALQASTPLLDQAVLSETAPSERTAPVLAERVLTDYRSQGYSLEAHPLQMLRSLFDRHQIDRPNRLRSHRHGQRARAIGLVTHRQRPGTAQGTIFLSLEDELGLLNVIVPGAQVEAQRQPILQAQLLIVEGTWQVHGPVRQLRASQLHDASAWLGQLTLRSRDFH